MKTSHMLGGLVALVLVVFFLTFFLNYVGRGISTDDTSSTDTAEEDPARLLVPIRVYPYLARSGFLVGRYELEHRHPGHQDYWFVNNSDETLRLGAVSKSCKCQGVEVFVLPDGYKARPLLSEPNPLVATALGVLGQRALGAFAEEREAVGDLEAVATMVTLNPDDPKAVAEVAPRRAGWVRMKWTGEKPGRQKLTVKLWEHHPNSGLEINLERNANFVDPVRVVQGEAALGRMQPKDLPRTVPFFVWSTTRKSFNVTKVEPVRLPGLPASADALVVGTPRSLTLEQCVKLQVQFNLRESQIRCAYEIPVTFQKAGPDGKTTMDTGPFRRRVDVVTDAWDKPVGMSFRGTLQGHLELQNVDENGGISFGSFRSDAEPHRAIYVHVDNPALKLELDQKRVPEHLQAALTEEPADGRSGKTWKLEVKVRPGVIGVFPRDDDPRYHDSALYVHTVGPAAETVRVAVRGDAAER